MQIRVVNSGTNMGISAVGSLTSGVQVVSYCRRAQWQGKRYARQLGEMEEGEMEEG